MTYDASCQVGRPGDSSVSPPVSPTLSGIDICPFLLLTAQYKLTYPLSFARSIVYQNSQSDTIVAHAENQILRPPICLRA